MHILYLLLLPKPLYRVYVAEQKKSLLIQNRRLFFLVSCGVIGLFKLSFLELNINFEKVKCINIHSESN